MAAYRTGDPAAIEAAAARLRPDRVDYDRTGMKAEIGAERTQFWFTALLPERWVEQVYPTGYFGKERNADWVR